LKSTYLEIKDGDGVENFYSLSLKAAIIVHWSIAQCYVLTMRKQSRVLPCRGPDDINLSIQTQASAVAFISV